MIATPLKFHTLVCGGGIMGLSVAYAEAKRGKKVLLWDNSAFGLKASWASAGILTNRDARIFHSTFREFQIRSQNMYPEWLADISDTASCTSGFEPIQLQKYGAYQIFPTNDDGQKALSEELDKLGREGARDYSINKEVPAWLAPWINKTELSTLYFPNESYVSNRKLLAALETACRVLGVELLPHTELSSINVSSNEVQIELSSITNNTTVAEANSNKMVKQYFAEHLVICAGIWSDGVLSKLGYKSPLVPVRGQAYSVPKFHQEKSFVHYGREVYMVPRSNDILVGVTTENHISSEEFTPEGEAEIRAQITEAFPSVAHMPIQERWYGIRPRTRDRQPLLGWLEEGSPIAICAGHYKSGIGMAPLSAVCISNLLNGEALPMEIADFNPQRKKGIKKI